MDLLQEFFSKARWEKAIADGVEKGINLPELCEPERRLEIYRRIRDGNYIISPPHEALIPKDDGTYRTVYVNTDTDRILLSIYNDMMFDLCHEIIHPACTSYQKGIGCGKIVMRISKIIQNTNTSDNRIGVKVDLSKYFDSVPIEFIDKIFAYIDNKFGKSPVTEMVKNYYHTNTVFDLNKNLITKYSSLRQGCAFAAFLADAVLYDIDYRLSKMDVLYVRYSDDILIIGRDWAKGYGCLQKMLSEKSLILNPKKVEILYNNKWFKFLGFMINGDKISLSKSRLKSFQKEIEKRTIKSNASDLKNILTRVYNYMYHGNGTYSWATSVLPIINVEADINTLNGFVMDSIRAAYTGKYHIGGLGFTTNKPDSVILRGKGKNVKSNHQKLPQIPNYYTVLCMKKILMTSKELYDTIIRTKM